MKESSHVWNKDKSILLSTILVYIFTIVLITLDVFGVRFSRWLSAVFYRDCVGMLIVWLYVCSMAAYLMLWNLYRLLSNLRNGTVFESVNVTIMRVISYCCFFVTFVCLLCSTKLPSLLVVSLAAGFVGLIVRIVKNVFEQAISMKDELDLTI